MSGLITTAAARPVADLDAFFERMAVMRACNCASIVKYTSRGRFRNSCHAESSGWCLSRALHPASVPPALPRRPGTSDSASRHP